MNIKSLLTLTLLLCASLQVSADETLSCQWQDQTLSIGESVWVLDPIIVKTVTEELRKKGLSEEQIAYRIKTGDWVGFRVECVEQVILNHNPQFKGDILKANKGVMIINEYGREYHQQLRDDNKSNAEHNS